MANPEGALIACSNQSMEKKNFTACLSNFWIDYNEIGKAELGEGEQMNLETIFLEHEV